MLNTARTQVYHKAARRRRCGTWSECSHWRSYHAGSERCTFSNFYDIILTKANPCTEKEENNVILIIFECVSYEENISANGLIISGHISTLRKAMYTFV